MDDQINKTREEKLNELGIDTNKHPFFSDVCVDIIYEKFKHTSAIGNKERERLLYILNEILEKLDMDYIKDINEFRVDRSKLMLFNGEDFINNHKELLVKYGIHLNNDLAFNNRNKIKNYGISMVKSVAKFYGYTVKSRIRTIAKDDKRQNVNYYIIEKNNDIE